MTKLFDFAVDIKAKTCQIRMTQAGIEFFKVMEKFNELESMKKDFNSILQRTIETTLKKDRTDLQ